MKYCFTLQIVFLILNSALSQNRVDSFIRATNSNVPYAARVKTYLAFGEKIGIVNFDEAVRLANMGITLATAHNDTLSAARFMRQKGEALYFLGKYDLAAKEFFASIKKLEGSREQHGLAETYNALAKLYRKTRDLPQAAKYYDKAKLIYETIKDSLALSAIYNESGAVFMYANDLTEALRRFNVSLEIDERLNDKIGIGYAYENIAGAYVLQNKFAEAEDLLKKALQIRQELKDSFAIAITYNSLGSTYLSAGKLTQARLAIDSSNQLARNLKYVELLSLNLELAGKIAEQNTDYKTALGFFRENALIKDSLFGLAKEKQISELNTKYETEKKERTIQDQKYSLRIQNILFAAGGILVLLASLLVYNLNRRRKLKREAIFREEEIKQKDLAARAVMEAEEGERYRIARDLHDGVGQIMSAAKMNLSAWESRSPIKDEKEKASLENIISLIDTGCKEVRAVSHKMMPIALTGKKLDRAIKDFIDQLDKNILTVHFYSEGFEAEIPSDVATIVYRIIQECVHNVLKHAAATVLDISLVQEGNDLTATIEDNGKGFEVMKDNSTDGIGLKNIRSRISYVNGTVDYTSEPGKGTMVAVHVPLNYEL